MKTIISIDWDHTLRNMTGIDLNILAVILYAKAKKIPVGLTTHRDIENTTLYTLYAWQYEKTPHESDALAAAISYWDEHLFKPLDIEFDFINARYQPRHENGDYYQESLLPLERALAEEIISNGILNDRQVVKEKIQQYAQPERFIENNEFKESQILWISKFFQYIETPLTLYHIDDSKEVCQNLRNGLSQLAPELQVSVNTIFYENSPLFSNESCVGLLVEIGLLNDVQDFMKQGDLMHALHDNHKACLAVIMVVLQIPNIDQGVFLVIENVLKKINTSSHPEILNLYRFVETLFIETKKMSRPICLMPNNLTLTKW